MPDDQAYCSLIKPEPGWVHWDKQAEILHGVSKSVLLEHGKEARLVAEQLNQLLQGKTVYSDAWGNDMSWISLLFDQVDLLQRFTVDALHKLLSHEQQLQWDGVKKQVMLDTELKRHRASSDARMLQQTYCQTLALLA